MVMAEQVSLEQILACGVDKDTAAVIVPQINQWLSSLSAWECWQHLTQHILKPEHPFPLHQFLYETTFSDWHINQGLPPAWFPTDEQIQATHIAALSNELKVASYQELHASTPGYPLPAKLRGNR